VSKKNVLFLRNYFIAIIKIKNMKLIKDRSKTLILKISAQQAKDKLLAQLGSGSIEGKEENANVVFNIRQTSRKMNQPNATVSFSDNGDGKSTLHAVYGLSKVGNIFTNGILILLWGLELALVIYLFMTVKDSAAQLAELGPKGYGIILGFPILLFGNFWLTHWWKSLQITMYLEDLYKKDLA
jgi:hypothetical protein